MKNIAILGSTGSIGCNSLQVISAHKDKYYPAYLTANKNIELLKEQILKYKPRGVVILDETKISDLKKNISKDVEILVGNDAICEIVKRDDVDIVINSLVGFAGLKPTVDAIIHKKNIALANKESLVVAGELITSLAKENGVPILPIDSEHSAILQCLAGEQYESISKIILTASGGPFLNLPLEKFSEISIEDALKHPNWKMGNKITIDSATMMNKGLEVIEAKWLFNLPPEKIEIVIHPQSIIHSLVEFIDGSVKAQLGLPDMKIPIQYALTYPKRLKLKVPKLNLPKLQSLTFFSPDRNKFRCIQLAYDVLKEGGTAPAIMNAANEVAVQKFLNKNISFTDIPRLIEKALNHQTNHKYPNLEQIIISDFETREYVNSLI